MLSGARFWYCRPQESQRSLTHIDLDADTKIEAHPENSGSNGHDHIFAITNPNAIGNKVPRAHTNTNIPICHMRCHSDVKSLIMRTYRF